MNKGTYEGNIAEIEFVKDFNKHKSKFVNYFNMLHIKEIDNYFMCRVTGFQFSKLSNKLVMTRADAYLIYITDEKVINYINNNDYYIDEEILKNNNYKYEYIKFSGISIKMTTSNKFQILKLTPDSFYHMFEEYEIGAGASMFCKRAEELYKNEMVLAGWKTNKTKIIQKYSKELPELLLLEKEISIEEKIRILSKLKKFSNNKIKEKIESSEKLKRIIFNGYYIYSEPYSATYFYKGNRIEKLDYIPFCVTTGSGRSRGDFTIVLKPA